MKKYFSLEIIIVVTLPCINMEDPSGTDRTFNSHFIGRKQNSVSVIFSITIFKMVSKFRLAWVLLSTTVFSTTCGNVIKCIVCVCAYTLLPLSYARSSMFSRVLDKGRKLQTHLAPIEVNDIRTNPTMKSALLSSITSNHQSNQLSVKQKIIYRISYGQ